MQPINSRQNERFKSLIELKKDKGLLMLEGRRLVLDALSRGYEPIHSAVTPAYIELHGMPQFDFIFLSEDLFSKLSDTQTPQGIIVFIRRPFKSLDELKHHDRLVILDGLQDPGNVGTIIRSAEAFGFGGIMAQNLYIKNCKNYAFLKSVYSKKIHLCHGRPKDSSGYRTYQVMCKHTQRNTACHLYALYRKETRNSVPNY